MSDTHLLPMQLRQVYEETHAALSSNQPVLAGIGLRAIVETVCKDRKAKGGNLEKKIDDLVTQNVLTPSGAEILHSLRLMGNDAAHEVSPHDAKALAVAMDVLEHTLRGVYVIPAHAAALPKRTRKRSGAPDTKSPPS
jgi:hypothetical protein